jgi:hypothetical protein
MEHCSFFCSAVRNGINQFKALLVTWLPDLYKPTCCAIQRSFEHAKMVLR